MSKILDCYLETEDYYLESEAIFVDNGFRIAETLNYLKEIGVAGESLERLINGEIEKLSFKIQLKESIPIIDYVLTHEYKGAYADEIKRRKKHEWWIHQFTEKGLLIYLTYAEGNASHFGYKEGFVYIYPSNIIAVINVD